MTSLPTSSIPHYSYQWASDLWQSFYSKHARATDNVMRILEITKKDCITMIATPGSSWNKLRDMIKITENWSRFGEIQMMDEAIIEYFKRKYGNSNEKLRVRLDKQLKRAHSERVGKECGVPSVKATAGTDGTLPFFHSGGGI